MGRRVLVRLACLVTLASLSVAPASASFHLMKIVEVFPGTQASPNAQYVVLQMYTSGQNLVSGHSIQVFNASGGSVSTFAFASNVANGANQAKILIGTTQASAFFGVSVDLTMTSSIPLAGGKVCFDSIDCVAWGNYTGSLTGVGTPFQSTNGGLRLGRAMTRRLNISGSSTNLDAGDDTNVCANDFASGTPAPRNNAGQNGTTPPATCGNSSIEGLEACDDGDTDAGDGCRADCAGTEVCGDLLVDTAVGETCDDGNTTGGDSCPADCVTVGTVPSESSPLAELRASRGAGSTVDLIFTPACSATNHSVYWGSGPIAGTVVWANSACGLGVTGAASFDPGTPAAGQRLYFVLVGYTDTGEGPYGPSSAGVSRPQAAGVGACDRPLGVPTCP